MVTYFVYGFVAVSFLANFCCAQQKNENIELKKIALYNRYAFEDDKTGIRRLVDAYATAENPGFIPERDINRDREQYEKRKRVLVDPILNEITGTLKRLESENNITILDGVELEENSLLLAFDSQFNMTDTLISYFNNKPRKSSEALKLDVAPSKVGSINTTILFDQKIGIKGFSEIYSFEELCKNKQKCTELSNKLQLFALGRGFSIILDSKKPLPDKLKELVSTDLTLEFIGQFNNPS